MNGGSYVQVSRKNIYTIDLLYNAQLYYAHWRCLKASQCYAQVSMMSPIVLKILNSKYFFKCVFIIN